MLQVELWPHLTRLESLSSSRSIWLGQIDNSVGKEGGWVACAWVRFFKGVVFLVALCNGTESRITGKCHPLEQLSFERLSVLTYFSSSRVGHKCQWPAFSGPGPSQHVVPHPISILSLLAQSSQHISKFFYAAFASFFQVVSIWGWSFCAYLKKCYLATG